MPSVCFWNIPLWICIHQLWVSKNRALPANESELTGRRAKPQAATKTYDELQLYTTKTLKPSEKKKDAPIISKTTSWI